MTSTITIHVPLAVQRQGSRKAILAPSDTLVVPSLVDITLVKAVARAFRWRRLLESGRYATINELAAAEKINASYVSRLLRLTLLSPQLVEAILDGRQSAHVTLPRLAQTMPPEWQEQCARLNREFQHPGEASDEPHHIHPG